MTGPGGLPVVRSLYLNRIRVVQVNLENSPCFVWGNQVERGKGRAIGGRQRRSSDANKSPSTMNED